MKQFFAAIILILPMFCQAQFVADTNLNTRVQDIPGSAQSTPLTATTGNGKTYVSWFDNSSGQYMLRMQLLDSLGQKLWAENGMVVSSFAQSSGLYRYDLVCDHEGNAIVGFQDERSGSMQVVVNKINNQGLQVWGDSGILFVDSTSTGLAPKLAVLGNNDVVVAWNAAGTVSGKWIPMRKIKAATGEILWSKRIAISGQKFGRPAFVSCGANDFIMLYVKETGSFFPPASTMFAQRFKGEDASPVWNQEVQVSTKNIPFFFFPEIQTDEKQGFFLVFNTGNPLNPMLNDAFAQHVDSSGGIWSAEGVQIATSANGNKYDGGYCWNPSDSTLCIALRIQDGNQTMSGISLQKINTAGERLLGDDGLELRALNTEMYTPWLLLNGGDGLVCIYGIGGFNNQKIKGLKTDYNGLALWSYDPIASASNSNKDDLSAGPFKNGQTVLVWSEDRSGDDGIYAQNLRLDGHFGNGDVTGIEQIVSNSGPRIFPNPGSNCILEFESTKGGNLTYRILDAGGKEIMFVPTAAHPGKNRISIGDGIKSGFYIAEITAEGKTFRIRMLKE